MKWDHIGAAGYRVRSPSSVARCELLQLSICRFGYANKLVCVHACSKYEQDPRCAPSASETATTMFGSAFSSVERVCCIAAAVRRPCRNVFRYGCAGRRAARLKTQSTGDASDDKNGNIFMISLRARVHSNNGDDDDDRQATRHE